MRRNDGYYRQHNTETIKRIFEAYKPKGRASTNTPWGQPDRARVRPGAFWYQFRWALDALLRGRMLRLFETGDREEDRVVETCAMWG